MRLPLALAALLLSSSALAAEDTASPSEAVAAEDHLGAGVTVLVETKGGSAAAGPSLRWRHTWAQTNAPIVVAEAWGGVGNEHAYGRMLIGADLPVLGGVEQGVLVGARAGVFGGEDVQPRLEVGLAASANMATPDRFSIGLTTTGMLYDGDGNGTFESLTVGGGLTVSGNLSRPRGRRRVAGDRQAVVRAPQPPRGVPPAAAAPSGPESVFTRTEAYAEPGSTWWRTVHGLGRGSPLPRVHRVLGPRRVDRSVLCPMGQRGFSYRSGAVAVCAWGGGARSVQLRGPAPDGSDEVSLAEQLIGVSESEVVERLGWPGSRPGSQRLVYHHGQVVLHMIDGVVSRVHVEL